MAQTVHYNNFCHKTPKKKTGKNLYVSPVGKNGKEFLRKIIRSFGHQAFDYRIFVYDDTTFPEPEFSKCHFIYERGVKWTLIKKHVPPESVAAYDYVFLWDDDIDIQDFSCENFLNIATINNLQSFQPALSLNSFYSIPITLQNPKYQKGRYVDFIEIMVPVFTSEAWKAFYAIIDGERNPWGWGYDCMAKSLCGFKNMGIIDSETVFHTRPIQSKNTDAPTARKKFYQRHKGKKIAKRVGYGELK
jgi:hypothetical protein